MPTPNPKPSRKPRSTEPPAAVLLFLVVGLLGATGIVLGMNRLSDRLNPPQQPAATGAVAGAHEEVSAGAILSDAPARQTDVPDFSELLTARSAAVIDARSGTVLFEKNATLVLPIASLTKLATASVVLESGVDLTGTAAVEREAIVDAGTGPDRFVSGEVVRRRDLFFAALVGSSNTAANVLARSIGLTSEEFVAAMNDLTQSLGLTETRFADPTGLDSGNVSTSLELATLAEYAFRSALVREATTTPVTSFSSVSPDVLPAGRQVSHRFVNTDKLLRDGIRLEAGKTGSLDESRYSFAALVSNDDGNEIVTVVIGAASDDRRFSETKSLSQWAFRAWSWEAR